MANAQTNLKVEPCLFKTFKNKQREVKTVEAEMGILMVPESRSKASSKKIALKFVRFKSTKENWHGQQFIEEAKESNPYISPL